MIEKRHDAALKLHQHLVSKHWRDGGLIGPDPGVRFNYRIYRFIKSYLAFYPWKDDLAYIQGQGYWILANWVLFDQTGDEKYRDIAIECSRFVIAKQRSDGAWEYPNPEWKGRVATAEGVWGSIGLLETYRRTKDQAILDSVLKWHHYLIEEIGFQEQGEELAINYFANRGDSRIPNNSITVLRFLAEIANATGASSYLKPANGLLAFIKRVQKESGEFPYKAAEDDDAGRPHFQCYQYNGFECLNFMRYYELTQDETVVPIIEKQIRFLSEGIAEDGHAYYDCGKPARHITYHTTAVAGALLQAQQKHNITKYDGVIKRAYAYVLKHQRSNGSFPHSHNDYQILSDKRSYPRYLAMILFHLLLK